jgi:hypothetical protein
MWKLCISAHWHIGPIYNLHPQHKLYSEVLRPLRVTAACAPHMPPPKVIN